MAVQGGGATRAGWPGEERQYLLPLLSGVVTVFAYPPFSVAPLAFLGLVPLLCWMDEPRSPREVFLGGMSFALPYFAGASYWMFYLGRFTPAGIPGGLGFMVLQWATFFIFPITVHVVRGVVRVPLPLIAPFAWTISEHARTHGDLFFPWVTLGYSLSDWPFLIQHADLLGVYGISWWLVLINCLVATLLRSARRARALLVCGVGLAVALLIPLGYNTMRWRQVERMISAAPTLSVAVVQPNIAQSMKWNLTTVDETFRTVNRLISEAESAQPDLVVAPEACLPLVLHTESTRLPDEVSRGTRPLLVGAVTGTGRGLTRSLRGREFTVYRHYYNSAYLVDADRVVLSRHDKQYLVPFTEQIPYEKVLGFALPLMAKQFGKFLPAENLHVMTLPREESPIPFGTLICYESLFPRLVARIRGMGARFLVNITNDAWFGRSTFPFQHAGLCTFRAIENRVSIVRAANTGVSAFYDPLGRSRPRAGIFHEAVLMGRIALTRESTVYARLGDVLLYVSYLVVVCFLGIAWRRYRPRSRTSRNRR